MGRSESDQTTAGSWRWSPSSTLADRTGAVAVAVVPPVEQIADGIGGECGRGQESMTTTGEPERAADAWFTARVRAAGGHVLGRASARVWVAAAVGAAAGIYVGAAVEWEYAASVGWDVAAGVFLVWTWSDIGGMDAATTASHATREDPTRGMTQVIVLSASVASLVGVGYLLAQASSARGATQDLVAALGVASVAVSWLVVHTLFTLRYALLYYGSDGGERSGSEGGVDFNQHEPPRYTDFAYLAFTIGMTFQVSDTQLTAHQLRATALRHALLSYLFGSLILAATVNLVASLASAGY
jgi:uncharacterized membrane protein